MRSAECGTRNETVASAGAEVNVGPLGLRSFIRRSAFRTPHSTQLNCPGLQRCLEFFQLGGERQSSVWGERNRFVQKRQAPQPQDAGLRPGLLPPPTAREG